MAGKKRTLARVKKREPSRAPAHPGASKREVAPKEKRTLATVRPYEPEVKTVDVRDCQECDGLTVEGMWIHGPGCPHMVVRWDRHGTGTWDCPHGCPATTMATSRTHNWGCRFWEEHPNLTPFDRRPGRFGVGSV